MRVAKAIAAMKTSAVVVKTFGMSVSNAANNQSADA